MSRVPKSLAERLASLGFRSLDVAPDSMHLDAKDLELLLGVSGRTVENWRSRGDGPRCIRVGARAVRYRLGDVRAWIGGAR